MDFITRDNGYFIDFANSLTVTPDTEPWVYQWNYDLYVQTFRLHFDYYLGPHKFWNIYMYGLYWFFNAWWILRMFSARDLDGDQWYIRDTSDDGIDLYLSYSQESYDQQEKFERGTYTRNIFKDDFTDWLGAIAGVFFIIQVYHFFIRMRGEEPLAPAHFELWFIMWQNTWLIVVYYGWLGNGEQNWLVAGTLIAWNSYKFIVNIIGTYEDNTFYMAVLGFSVLRSQSF